MSSCLLSNIVIPRVVVKRLKPISSGWFTVLVSANIKGGASGGISGARQQFSLTGAGRVEENE